MVDTFDLIVIGSGAGMNVGSNALQKGMKVALLEHGPMGGTCLNNGCIPTKILTTPADYVRTIGDAEKVGVKAKIESIDFPFIMSRMHEFVEPDREAMTKGIEHAKNLTWYPETGEFVGEYKLKTGKTVITAPKIVIAAGSRPLVPDIPGLKETGFLDNVSALLLKKPPKSLIIMGGGYIAYEYGHFFSAIGTKVTILERNPRLLKMEEPEISEIAEKRFGRFANIRTNFEVESVSKDGAEKVVHTKNLADGKLYKFKAEQVMLALGRRSNADLFKPAAAGILTDKAGWIMVNEHLETNKPGIFAFGDALGKYMFRHTANYEAEIVWHNLFAKEKAKVDFSTVPHAVFGYPQIGSVGMTQEEAKTAGHKLLIGKASYADVTKGYAMAEDESLITVIVDMDTRRILGAHIVGSEAADLVMQIVYLMNAGDGTYRPMARAQIIHPALSEAVARAFGNMAPEGHVHTHG